MEEHHTPEIKPENKKSDQTDDVILKLFENELKNYPQVLEFINKLQELLERQRKLLYKYHEKFKQMKKEVVHVGIQTNDAEMVSPCLPSDDNKGAIDINDIVQAAHTAVQQTGFVYEPVSGLYYDYKTGYYYNSELGLYYDGATSNYLYYNEEENKFIFHSKAQQVASKQSETKDVSSKVNQHIRQSGYPQLKEMGPDFRQATSTNSQDQLPLENTDMLSDVSSNSDIPDDIEPGGEKKSKHNKRGSEELEDGEISSEEIESISSEDNQDVDMAQTLDTRKSKLLDYYNSEEYRQYYENYCKSVTMQYSKTPVAYNPQSEEAKNINPALRTEEYEIANAWPPSLRIIVRETSVKGIQTGTLFIVTYLGGSVGREGEHAVLIPDINISKHHAKIIFTGSEDKKDDPTKGYVITDLGSRNGTYLDNTRLSVALQESEPHLIKHGSELRIGSTKLLVHIHNGRDTCDECEPGVLMFSSNKVPTNKIELNTDSVREKRQAELKRLRKKFGLDKTPTVKVKSGSNYEDRAEIRRKTVGSHVEGEKTQVATVTESIPIKNKGFQMLSKMGWKSGQTLGKDETNSDAIVEPIVPQQYSKNAGLGSSTTTSSVTLKEKKKTDVWLKTQARYKDIGEDAPS